MISPESIAELAQSQYSRIQPYIFQTPLLHSPLSDLLLIKAENLQKTGSFKLRGAASMLLHLHDEGRLEIITASSGNHGLAVLHLAKELGMHVRLFVPEHIQPLKEEKLRSYPVDLVKIEGDAVKSEQMARKMAAASDIPFVSPYNDPFIIAGQASIALELDQQVDLDDIGRIYITIGGGGLITGIASVLHSKYPHIEIIGCQPRNSAAMYAAVKAGEIIEIDHQPTLSDGSAGGIEDDAITFPLVEQLVSRIVLVDESQITHAMILAFRDHNSIIEGAAGVALAAYLSDLHQGNDQSSIVVWCGGNIDPHFWADIVTTKD